MLGHGRYGAVAAAVADVKGGHIADVLKAIQPAVKETKGRPGDKVDYAIRANALDVAERLQATGPILAERTVNGRIRIVGAYISLDTGKVELLERRKK